MRKIKILRIIARLNVGGPAKHVALLTEGLKNERHSSLLIYGSLDKGEGDMSYLIKKDDIKSIFIPELVRRLDPIRDFIAFIKILSIIKKEKPDIVHTHTAKAGTIGRIAAALSRVPVKIHTFHGHIFYGYFDKWSTAFFLWVERMLSYFTDCIIVISDNQKDELLIKYKIGTRQKYRVINLGLDLQRFSYTTMKQNGFREKHRFKEDEILVGMIGRLVPVKNHRMFIRIIKHVRAYIPEEVFDRVKFVIVGDGPEKESLVGYAKSQGVSERIVFTGWIEDMAEVYSDIDIVALTSKNEGTPLSLIEALASGRPVISTDVGGVRDLIGNTGILVDEGDEAAFSQNLSELIRSPDMRREIGLKGRGVVMEKFSKENLISQIEKLYEELLLEKGVMI